MSILSIHRYPSPILRQTCRQVTVWDDPVQRLIEDMVETMYAFDGSVGLAAPQVGHALRLFVMDVTARTTRDRLLVLANPVITQQSRNKMAREGCLSFPNYLAQVRRATRLTVEAANRHGEVAAHRLEKLEAIAVQHEIDHLDGVLMIDRVASLKTNLIRRHAAAQDHEA